MMNANGKNFKREAGFTLVEIVVVIAIVGVLAALAGPVLSTISEAMILKAEREDIREQTTYTLMRINREIRRIRSPEDVLTANASEFEFVDIDGDTIRYRVSAGSLLRQENGGTERTFATNVTALNFTYYYLADSDVDTSITPLVGSGANTDIQRIQIELQLTSGNHVVSVQSQVNPFNFIQESDVFP